jgi:hypothetical protein
VVLNPEAVGDTARVLVDARLERGDTPGQVLGGGGDVPLFVELRRAGVAGIRE